jgi:NAD-dependent dihydropyrimidine dehydrogenase PreA subunit
MTGAMTGTVTIGGCQGCGACLLTCPEHAIRPAGRALVVRDDLCTACGECVEVCPVDAITLSAVAGRRSARRYR